MTDLKLLGRRILAAGTLSLAAAQLFAQTGDYIVAVVNQELVTASEVQQRVARVREEAARNRATLPPLPALRKQVLEQLIDERVLVTNARDTGARIDDPEIDRAVANVATQNQMTLAQLRERLRKEGIPFAKFRENIRDQIMVERVREREVVSRIKVSDAEIDELIEKRRIAAGTSAQINVAQILVTVPDGAGDSVVAERRSRIDAALKRVRGGEDFATVAREISEDSNRAQGGEMGLRPVDRLPDLFARAVQPLKPGDITPEPIRSGAGFHVLKLIDRKESQAFTVDQSRVRHILLRPSPELSAEAAARRLLQFKRDIQSRARTFEQLARDNSEDASAAQGGDLGWTAPGSFVPEFEEAMAALPVGGISDPVTTRFGLHLIQVIDRRQTTLDSRQLREQARNILREQKFEAAFTEWLRDLRGRAYVEYREPPQ
jgi:peptidyl-prolyl cis-trans isomerase SurA